MTKHSTHKLKLNPIACMPKFGTSMVSNRKISGQNFKMLRKLDASLQPPG